MNLELQRPNETDFPDKPDGPMTLLVQIYRREWIHKNWDGVGLAVVELYHLQQFGCPTGMPEGIRLQNGPALGHLQTKSINTS